MMAKQLDKVIADILKKHGFDHKAAWDCHGTWVVYHNVLEKIAAKEGITFQQPFVCSADPSNIAICVTGELKDRVEWSIGEAAPKNCKNVYYWAMAEKRAKDRVILKLIGLAGLVYSEEEAYDLKAEGKGVWEAPKWNGPIQKSKIQDAIVAFNKELDKCTTSAELADTREEYKELWEQIKVDVPNDAKLTNPDCASGQTTWGHIKELSQIFKHNEEINQQQGG